MSSYAGEAAAVSTEQSQLRPSADATVILDIGGDIGALILLTGAELLLAELEVSRVDGGPVSEHDHGHGGHPGHDHHHLVDDHHDGSDARTLDVAPRTHVAVRERQGPDGSRFAAIYPELRSGEYTVWGVDGMPRETVTIVGGEVTQLDWR